MLLRRPCSNVISSTIMILYKSMNLKNLICYTNVKNYWNNENMVIWRTDIFMIEFILKVGPAVGHPANDRQGWWICSNDDLKFSQSTEQLICICKRPYAVQTNKYLFLKSWNYHDKTFWRKGLVCPSPVPQGPSAGDVRSLRSLSGHINNRHNWRDRKPQNSLRLRLKWKMEKEE